MIGRKDGELMSKLPPISFDVENLVDYKRCMSFKLDDHKTFI